MINFIHFCSYSHYLSLCNREYQHVIFYKLIIELWYENVLLLILVSEKIWSWSLILILMTIIISIQLQMHWSKKISVVCGTNDNCIQYKRQSQWQKIKLWNHTYLYCGCDFRQDFVLSELEFLQVEVSSGLVHCHIFISFWFQVHSMSAFLDLFGLNYCGQWTVREVFFTFWLSGIIAGFSLLGERNGEQKLFILFSLVETSAISSKKSKR